MRMLVVGASGFIGSSLARRLAERGHDVTAASRRAPAATEGVKPLTLDVEDEQATQAALSNIDVAYYLVHSLDAGNRFAKHDRVLAERFARAAAAAGVERIIYLGGLGSGDLSDHLRSRQEVGVALASTGIDVTELRAAVILGAGSISFEMMRYLVERLPAMVCPRWVKTPIEPIGLADVLDYLERAPVAPPGIYGIGGGTVTTYRELMLLYARVRGLPARWIIDVPLLTLHLSSYWVDLVTPVDSRVSHALIESLAVAVIVPDRDRTDSAFGVQSDPLDVSIAAALAQQVAAIDEGLLQRPTGLADGVYVVRARRKVTEEQARLIAKDLAGAGGDIGWYGIPLTWRLRLFLGRLVGEQNNLTRPLSLEAGSQMDWWQVVRWDGSALVLRADGWKSGEAWLAFQVEDGPAPALTLHAAFQPKGAFGFLYWRLLGPVHRWAFNRMIAHRIDRAA